MTRREVFQDFAEIAAGRTLDRHRGDEQRQVVLADAEIEIAHAGFEIGAVGDFIGDDAEFAADRIGHLARHHGDRDRHRMTGAQAAHDDVQRVGKLRAERLLPPAAHDLEDQAAAAACSRTARRQSASSQIAARDHQSAEGEQRADADVDRELADADGQAGLQDQPVERHQRQPVVAAAAQSALAAQLHQHALRDRARSPSAAGGG